MQTRRALLTGGTAVGLAGCLGLGGGDGNDGSDDQDDGGDGATADPPDGPIANAPTPDDPGSYTYARMGTGDGPVVTYVGNWKCPVCAEFSTGSERVLALSTVVTDFVAAGALDLEYRALCYTGDGEPFLGADAPRAGRAGLGVWNVDPGAYWRYHEYVMAEQPPESQEWATRDTLVEFADGAGVSDPEAVGSAISDGTYADPVEATTGFALDHGVEGTPSLVIDGEVYSPFDPEETRSALEALAGE